MLARSLFCAVLITAIHASPAASPDPPPRTDPAAPARLTSTIFDWNELKAIPTKTGERRDIVNSPTPTLARLEAHITTLRAGEAPHPSHVHADEEIVIVKEGQLKVVIGSREKIVGPGSMIFFAANEPHGVSNAGETPVTYYIIRLLAHGPTK